MNIYFSYPAFLYLLLIIPIFVFLYFLSASIGKKRAIEFSNFEALERISGIEFFSKSFFVLFLDIVLIVLLIFSISGMNVVYNAKTDSFSHVILIDNSRSMSVTDLGESRLDLAKIAAKNFVDFMPSSVEFGVVAFAGEAEIVKRIDSSRIATKSAIDIISVSSIEGSNLFNALVLADSLFSGQRKSVLLIGDGEFTFNNLSDIVRYANENEIVLNTIVVGTFQGARDEFGGLHRIDSDLMKALAFNTEGKYFELTSSEVPRNFQEVFVETERKVRKDLTIYLLFSALVVFIVIWVINNFRIKVFP